MIVAAEGTVPLWVYLVTMLGGLVLSAVLVVLGTYPMWKDRKVKEVATQKREKRLDATADAVLGREADRDVGQPEVRGLLSLQTVMAQQVEEMHELLDHMIVGQTRTEERNDERHKELVERFDQHMAADDNRFDRIERSLSSMKRQARAPRKGSSE